MALKEEAEHCVHEMLFWLHMPINEKNVKDGSFHILELLQPREEKISTLDALIEKMKCCANCENYCQRIDNRCNTKCKNHSLWKLNEDFGWRTESN